MNTSFWSEADKQYMHLALDQAKKALAMGEVPVGAVLVVENQIFTGHNQPISTCDPTAHAEIVAMRQAAKALGRYRLEGAKLYVSLEPCVMCVGALMHARLAEVNFALDEPKTGALQSIACLCDPPFGHGQLRFQGGLLAEASQALLSGFFESKRS